MCRVLSVRGGLKNEREREKRGGDSSSHTQSHTLYKTCDHVNIWFNKLKHFRTKEAWMERRKVAWHVPAFLLKTVSLQRFHTIQDRPGFPGCRLWTVSQNNWTLVTKRSQVRMNTKVSGNPLITPMQVGWKSVSAYHSTFLLCCSNCSSTHQKHTTLTHRLSMD